MWFVSCYVADTGIAENEILEIFAFDKDLWQSFLKELTKDHNWGAVKHERELKDKKFQKIPIAGLVELYSIWSHT